MKAKIEYNPNEPNGQLYYMEFDVMLMFSYEYYKKDVLMINIPIEFDERFKKRREEILNFIGNEVATRQLKPSYYKVTNTSIEVRRITALYRLKTLPIKTLSGTVLLILGSYMASKGIVWGTEPYPRVYNRRNITQITGPSLIAFGIALLIIAYFNRKKNKNEPQ